MAIGWGPPDLNEFEVDNSGFAHRKPKHGRRMIAGGIVALVLFSAIATCELPTAIGTKMAPPPDRATVSAEARYP